MSAGRTLYDVLGVPAGASSADLRRAYRERARQLHPDRHIDDDPAARAEAERRMRELTAAYRVLGDEGRRRTYDLTLDVPRALTVDEVRARLAAEDDDDDVGFDGDELLDGPVRLVRGLPWIALVAVLVIIFIFSAYAITGGPKGDDGVLNQTKVGTCVVIGADSRPSAAGCGEDGARHVIALVPASTQCPEGTERVLPPEGSAAYCVGA